MKSEIFLAEMKEEFPHFSIRHKRDSSMQRAIGIFLRVVTLGRMSTYATHYHTVLFGTLWVPDSWDRMSDIDRVILLRHERVHLRQRRRMGDALMSFVYLVPICPLFLAYGRARIEWEAYEETIAATAELLGMDRARALKPELVRRFVGPDYGWMWPFPKTIERWFDEHISRLSADSISC